MRTTLIRFAAIFGLVLGALAFGTAASADPGTTTGGADVTGACSPGPVRLSFGYVVKNICAQDVQTPSGNANLVFHADVAAPSTAPDHAVVITGFFCVTTYGPTLDSKVTITPSGEINGECHRAA